MYTPINERSVFNNCEYANKDQENTSALFYIRLPSTDNIKTALTKIKQSPRILDIRVSNHHPQLVFINYRADQVNLEDIRNEFETRNISVRIISC